MGMMPAPSILLLVLLTLATCADEAQWGCTLEYLFLDECASALKRNHTRYDLHNSSQICHTGNRARNPLFFIIGTLLFLLSKNSPLYPVLRQWALLLSFIVSDLSSMACH